MNQEKIKKTALISGIAGQDGSYLTELLLSKGYEVHGIIRWDSIFTTERIDHLYRDPHINDVKLFLHYGAMPGTPQGEGQEEGQKDLYGSTQEIALPTGLASELKSIFSEVCEGAKLTTLNYNFPTRETDMLVYVWKNKPTEEKLISAFEKNGYEIEMPGDILIVKKGNTGLSVDWVYQMEEQEIVVLVGKEE